MFLLFGKKHFAVLPWNILVFVSALLCFSVTGVKRLSVSELNELLEEIETAIKEYSEELVQQLALRDELEFEKEVKNSFISVLIEVQNKQKEHKETAKKKKKLKNSSSQNGKNERSHMPGTVSGVVWVTRTRWKRLPWGQQRRAGPACAGAGRARGLHQRAEGLCSRLPVYSAPSERCFLGVRVWWLSGQLSAEMFRREVKRRKRGRIKENVWRKSFSRWPFQYLKMLIEAIYIWLVGNWMILLSCFCLALVRYSKKWGAFRGSWTIRSLKAEVDI